MHALHIQNLSICCRQKYDPSISRVFESYFWRVFCYLAQLRVRVGGRDRAEAEAEDVSRGLYARHCRLTLLSCLEPILPLVLLLCIVDVLWGQPIKLIQVVSTSEFHEY